MSFRFLYHFDCANPLELDGIRPQEMSFLDYLTTLTVFFEVFCLKFWHGRSINVVNSESNFYSTSTKCVKFTWYDMQIRRNGERTKSKKYLQNWTRQLKFSCQLFSNSILLARQLKFDGWKWGLRGKFEEIKFVELNSWVSIIHLAWFSERNSHFVQSAIIIFRE